MPSPGFHGLRVLALESRRATEIAQLIRNAGGEPMIAPSMREVPLAAQSAVLEFDTVLEAAGFDWVLFLTGGGVRDMAAVLEARREPFLAALRRVHVAARGPKAAAALRELQIPVAFTAPEPCTWRELLAALDLHAAARGISLQGARIAIQEYGASNPELLAALRARGAVVAAVPVYRWQLPEDLDPLRRAVRALLDGQIDVVLFTNAVQVTHLFQIAAAMNVDGDLPRALARTVVASIGPSTSAELRAHSITPAVEPAHPRMGFLIHAAAERAAAAPPTS